MKTRDHLQKLDDIQPLRSLGQLPNFVFLFVFRNLGHFSRHFWLFSMANALTNIFSFIRVVILGKIISDIATLSVKDIFWIYIPLWILLSLTNEALDYFIRKYAEAMPSMYAEHLRLRFYTTFLKLPFGPLLNFSKEKLNTLVSKYTAHVQAFLEDWLCASTVGKATRFLLIIGVLFYQSPLVGVLNLLYMGLFLWLALTISARFSPYAKRFSQAQIETSSVYTNLAIHLSALKRLQGEGLFLRAMRPVMLQTWQRLSELKLFHANRWYLQLNLFNFLYIGTLSFGIYQVKQAQLPIGFLVLIKWSFDELWHILVYIIEHYVALLQQREDTKILKSELEPLLAYESKPEERFPFESLSLQQVEVCFPSKSGNELPFSLSIPNFEVRVGEKIGILGKSGTGKSTLLHLILNLIPYRGVILENGSPRAALHRSFDLGFVSSYDPLFQFTILENIALGREFDPQRLDTLLQGLKIKEFAGDLSMCLGQRDSHLSAGQESRIKLARGLLVPKKLFLFDEPFNGIDTATRSSIIAFLKDFLRDSALVMVTHDQIDLGLIDKKYQLQDGKLELS